MGKISASTFIRNNNRGAFCLWESMASWLCLPMLDEMIVFDLGSTDGTWEMLGSIAAANKRVRAVQGQFSCVDAKAFADAANICVQACENDTVLFWQADEVPHQHLLHMLKDMLDNGANDIVLWRYQLKYNFQRIKWFPYPCHRIGPKGNFVFIGDGMNTSRYMGPPVCSSWNMGQFTKWGSEYEGRPTELPTHEMLFDLSQTGAFLQNLIDKRRLHSPMWHERDAIEGIDAQVWYQQQLHNPDWKKCSSPFNIPQIMQWHVGRQRYDVRDVLIDALRRDTTQEIIGYA